MRVFVCPTCNYFLGYGSDGSTASGVTHGSHSGADVIELPGVDHTDPVVVDWFQGQVATTLTGAKISQRFVVAEVSV